MCIVCGGLLDDDSDSLVLCEECQGDMGINEEDYTEDHGCDE